MSKLILAKTPKMGVLDPKVDLAQHEAIIERGMSSFIEVGNALGDIQNNREYEQAGFTTFKEYCKGKWGWTYRHVHGQIEAAKVAQLDFIKVNRGSLSERLISGRGIFSQ